MRALVYSFILAGWFTASAPAATTNIFFTQFEAAEGYSTNFFLGGQANWLSEGSGDNGIVANFIPGQGQQAYVGGGSPLPADESLLVWRPLNFNPSPRFPIITFSVLLNIADSLNDAWDIFRWSVYNSQSHRLFSLDFDNYFDYLDVSYLLDGTNAVIFSDVTYRNNSNYTLTVTMNFAANRWSARLDNAVIATNQPITTTGASLNLGDVAAVWLIFATNAPGDNFMLFDNYRVTAETIPPAQVQFLERTPNGSALLRVFGENNTRWALEATTNFVNWTALNTNLISSGSYDHIDTTAAGLARRYYRARFVP